MLPELSVLATAAVASLSDPATVASAMFSGVVGNRTDALAMAAMKTLRERLASGELKDVNHDIEAASLAALREAAAVFAEEAARRVEKKPPFLAAWQRRKREGSLRTPLIEFRRFPEHRWLDALQTLVRDDTATAELHRRLGLDEDAILDAVREGKGEEEAARRFHEAFRGWLAEHLPDPAGRPPCVDEFLRDGWPLAKGRADRITLYGTWHLFFTEQVKRKPEVFHKLSLDLLAALGRQHAVALPPPDRAAFEAALDAPLAGIHASLEAIIEALDRIEGKVDGVAAIAAETLDLATESHGILQEVQARFAHVDIKPLQPDEPFKADIARLLNHNAAQLFGRGAELARLDAAYAGGATRVFALIAFGGVGKTTLTARWLSDMKQRGWPGLERVFGWTFYNEGTRQDGEASSDAFFSRAFDFFGETGDDLARLSPWDKGARLARAAAARRTLLVLDGLEPLQLPKGDHGGMFRDQAVAALLTDLAHGEGRGFCLVTSRENVVELDACAAAESLDLETLPAEAGAALLHNQGANKAGTTPIAPDDAELQAASRDAKGHALTLHILGLYLAKAHHGDIRKRDTVALAQADARYKTNPQDLASPYGHAFKMMAAYERWLEQAGPEGERQLAVLRLLGLFDRPADPGCLAALRAAPPIAGLTEPLADLAEADWNLAVSALEDARLVQPVAWQPMPVKGYDEATAQKRMKAFARLETFDLGEPAVFRPDQRQLATGHALDAHPLLRDYFARRLRDTDPDAWREGHRRLYQHLKDSVPYWPEGEAGLQPLYQAVGHGCRASLCEEACAEIYRDRIGRRGDFYSTNQLGLFGADLGAVAGFFDPPWTRPVPELAEADRAWLLNQAASWLRALGRLAEALEPMRANLEMRVAREEWQHAPSSAGNLSELELALGQVAAAVEDAGRAVEFADADRSGDAFQRMSKRTTLADAQHQAGEAAAALARFEEAEALQAERQPDYPRLYSLGGFRYCDALLAEAERAAWSLGLPPVANLGRDALSPVAERAARTLEWAVDHFKFGPLAIALDHLTLARAALYAALLDPADPPANALATAREHAAAALAGLRAAGQQQYVPLGLLTRAWLHTVEGQPDAARALLTEAGRIATRGGMRLHLADVHLYRARLFQDRAALAEARRLIEDCGYGRRLPELEDAEEAAKGW